MAFNNSPGRAEYVATAGQSVFIYVFKAYTAADIKVYLTPSGQTPDDVADLLILTTDYTVVVSGDAGGTITLVVAASAGDKITLVRSLDIDRLIEYQTNGDLLADTLNNDQNYQTYLIADKESDNTRFLKLPESAQGISTAVPPPVPLNFFQWNAAGTAIVNVSSLQADGFIWTAADVYNKTETNALLADKVDTTTLDENAKLWDAQTVTHDFTTDADYTLTSAQNAYGRIVLNDTGVVLTTGRNVITDNVEKSFTIQNNTAQTITVKTLAGTGIAILAGEFATLYSDGTNIITLEQNKEIGVGQVWVDETSNRLPGVTYTNNTDKPIQISIGFTSTVTGAFYVDAIKVQTIASADALNTVSVIVPAGSTYESIGGTLVVNVWAELK